MILRNKIDFKRYLLFVSLFCLLTMTVISCGGGGGGTGNDYTPPQPSTGVPHDILLSSDKTVGQSNAPIYMTALVTDVNGRPVKNTDVTFTKTSSTGIISPNLLNAYDFKEVAVYKVQTDLNGRASVKVTSTSSGYVTVEAFTGSGLMARRSILFTSSGTIVNNFTPITVVLDVDGNGNSIYNEKDDYKVCQTTTDQTVRIKATAYVKGEKASNIGMFVTTDLSKLVNFYNNIYGIYSVNPATGARTLTGCDYNGDGVVDSVCYTTHTGANGAVSYWFNEDRIFTNTAGEATTDFRISCQTITQERLLSVMAATDSYSFPEFSPTRLYYGTGATTLFIEPIVVSSVTVSANPTEVAAGDTSYITATVNTTLGSATAPDGTFVQFYADCKDSTSNAETSFNPQTAQTVNGKATTIFTAPTQIPAGDSSQCTIEARVSAVSGFIGLTVNRSLEVSPVSQTLTNPKVGDTATFNIVGGSKPYSVRSGNPAVSVSVSGSKVTATVVTVPDADTTNVPITVTDTKHREVTVTLVLTLEALTITPPSQTLISPPVGTSATYTVRGGKGPYKASVSDPQMVSTSVSDTTLNVTTLLPITTVNAKSITITVMDARGKTATAALSLSVSSGLTITPAKQTLSNPPVGTSATYTIIGGKSPYSVSTDYPQMVSATVNGNTITVTTKVAITLTNATTVAITVTDSSGVSGAATLELKANASALTIMPATQTITSPRIGDTVQYTIVGGTPAYTVTVSHPQIVRPTVNAQVITLEVISTVPPQYDSQGNLIVTTITINILDTNGQSGTATLLIQPIGGNALSVLPATRTYTNPPVGSKYDFAVSGGTKPYKATVSHPSLVSVTVNDATITLTTLVAITPNNAAAVTLYVTDANNLSGQANLTLVSQTGGALVVTPPSRILTMPAKGTIADYTVSGGKAPYTVTNDHPQLVNSTISGSTITLTLLEDITDSRANTTISFIVTDSNSLTGTGNLAFALGSLAVFPAIITLTSPNVGDTAVFDIFGGSPPYKVYSSRPDLVDLKVGSSSSSASGTPLTATIRQSGASDNVTIQVLDGNTRVGNCMLTIQ
ncbi:MAG: hypothetical protein HQL06_07040 [Nitrospirae bacterium]|nr:hypothetical protein [Nitrospirota bacterium]